MEHSAPPVYRARVANQQQPTPTGSAPGPESFEQSLAQLEAIIARIESGEVGLERSIAEYERGVALIKRCREILGRAEQRVEELTRQMDHGAGNAGGSTGAGSASGGGGGGNGGGSSSRRPETDDEPGSYDDDAPF